MASGHPICPHVEKIPSYHTASQMLIDALSELYTAESVNFSVCRDTLQAQAILKDRQENGYGSKFVDEATQKLAKCQAAQKEAADAHAKAKLKVEQAQHLHKVAFAESDLAPAKRRYYDGF